MGGDWKKGLERLAEALGSGAKRDEALAPYTSFRIGGPADLFLRVESIPALQRAVRLARECAIPYLLLGAGSNVLVADEGVRGLVLVNSCTGLGEEAKEGGSFRLWAESGVRLPKLSRILAERCLSGLEWAEGIPGSLGGAVAMNAGAFGACLAERLSRLEVMDGEGMLRIWDRAELRAGYRTSVLREAARGMVVARAELALDSEGSEAIQGRLAEYAQRRRGSQPQEPSAGSAFKNPLDASAGFLIERAGLKGFSRGGAQVSPVHANFIVNRGEAKASDVLYLIELIREKVHKEFGIALELEIELVGFATERAPVGRH